MIPKLPDELANRDFAALLEPVARRMQSMRDAAGLILMCYFAGFDDDKMRRPNAHAMLEGLNGLAKTTLVGEITAAICGPALGAFYDLTGFPNYVRTAGGPDATPADYVGFDQPGYTPDGKQRLVFVSGPILQDKLVHYNDEQNRSPPKTQSVWLEPMAEGGRVTVTTLDADIRYQPTRRLIDFWLIASQNPMTQEGTFPLPEAMADRFMVLITMSYTDRLHELIADPPQPFAPPDRTVRQGQLRRNLVAALSDPAFAGALDEAIQDEDLAQYGPQTIKTLGGAEAAALRAAQPISSQADYDQVRRIEIALLAARRAQLRSLKAQVRKIGFDVNAARYASRLVYDTWTRKAYAAAVGGSEADVPIPIDRGVEELVGEVAAGASPRAAIALRALSKAYAWALRGTTAEVRRDDIENVAPPVLRHRLLLRFQSAMNGVTPDDVIRRILDYRRRTR